MIRRKMDLLEVIQKINEEEHKAKCIEVDKLVSTVAFVGYQMTTEEIKEFKQLLLRVLDRMATESV